MSYFEYKHMHVADASPKAGTAEGTAVGCADLFHRFEYALLSFPGSVAHRQIIACRSNAPVV